MEIVQSRRSVRFVRLLLLAVLAGVAWCVLSLFAPSASASAQEHAPGTGLLGVVDDTLSGVTDALQETTGAVQAVVDDVAEAAAPATAPVAEPADPPPSSEAPTAAPVAAETIADVVDAAITSVAEVTTSVAEVTTSVAEVGQAGAVSHVSAPVVRLVGALPVVGTVADRLEVDTALTATAEKLDGAVARVLGAPAAVDDLIPSLPSSPAGAPHFPGAGGALPAVALAPVDPTPDAPSGASFAQKNSAHPPWPVTGVMIAAGQEHASSSPAPAGEARFPAEGPPPAAATSSSGGISLAASAHEHPRILGDAGPRTAPAPGEAPPGSPVFDTDVSPD